MSGIILLIEDDENSAILTRRDLQRANIKNPIVTYAYGAQALLHLESKDIPSLILLDLALPDMHGIDILKYIRHHERDDIRGLCVFVLTLTDDQEIMIKTIDTGANAFLRKDLNMGSFLSAVQDCGIALEID